MSGVWFELLLVLVLVLLNAGFAGSEVALISLREGQLKRLGDEGGPGRLVARLARNPDQFLSTIQIGIILAGFLASATAAVSLAQPLVGPLGFLGGLAEAVAVVLVTVVLTFVTLGCRGARAQADRIATPRTMGQASRASAGLDHLRDLPGRLACPVMGGESQAESVGVRGAGHLWRSGRYKA
jgi:putative hemolysin